MILSSAKFPSTIKSAFTPSFLARSITVNPSTPVSRRLTTTRSGAPFSRSASPSVPSPVTPHTTCPACEKQSESSAANASLLSRIKTLFMIDLR